MQSFSYFRGKACKMVGKTPKIPQLNIFQTPLKNFIDMKHELCILAHKIDWESIENDLSKFYSDFGRPSVPIRKMVGLMLLKRIYNLSDENVVDRWIENPYWQYFCGEVNFQTKKPFDPSEFVHFRQRMGEEGAERLLKVSVQLFGKEAEEKEVLIDSTVQEKNITYPTDAKLHKKIIEHVRKLAAEEDIKLRQSYKRIVKQLMIDQRFRSHPKRMKKAKSAERKLKTIAGRVIRDLERKMNAHQLLEYKEMLELFNSILNQKKTDSNKIYSIHEPRVKCIAKGKEAKKYEFGNKSGIALTRKSGIIVSAIGFEGNPYDGHTLDEHLDQIERLTGRKPKTAIVDRGYRGKQIIGETEICSPKPIKNATSYQKRKARLRFRARAGIEPLIGHIKHDHRMLRNYLKGTLGDKVNTIMAATGFNLMKKLNQIKRELSWRLIYLFKIRYLYA